MSTMTIRNIDDDLKSKLRVRAAENGRSMEAEVRNILKVALDRDLGQVQPVPEKGLGTWIHEHFAEIGGVELDIPKRDSPARYVEFPESSSFTNVISELMLPFPSHRVMSWLDDQDQDLLFITSITLAESLYGIERLPDGRRKSALATYFGAMLDERFRSRILGFDEQTARGTQSWRRDVSASADVWKLRMHRSPPFAERAMRHWRRGTLRTSRRLASG